MSVFVFQIKLFPHWEVQVYSVRQVTPAKTISFFHECHTGLRQLLSRFSEITLYPTVNSFLLSQKDSYHWHRVYQNENLWLHVQNWSPTTNACRKLKSGRRRNYKVFQITVSLFLFPPHTQILVWSDCAWATLIKYIKISPLHNPNIKHRAY